MRGGAGRRGHFGVEAIMAPPGGRGREPWEPCRWGEGNLCLEGVSGGPRSPCLGAQGTLGVISGTRSRGWGISRYFCWNNNIIIGYYWNNDTNTTNNN